MHALIKFLEPHSGELFLVIAPKSIRYELLEFVARLSCRGPVRVLDGGNSFNVYVIARALRRRGADMDQALNHMTVARAFTCYQMLALLTETRALQNDPLHHSALSEYPSNSAFTFVFDLLSTFYDENVPLHERRRLLDQSVVQLQRLSGNVPLLVSVQPPKSHQPEGFEFLRRLQRAADRTWVLKPRKPAASSQLPLDF